MARNRPRPLDKFVWVEHESGKQRRVLRARLPSLSPEWKRIPDPTKKTSAPAGTQPSASPSETDPAEPPDSEQGDTDGLRSPRARRR